MEVAAAEVGGVDRVHIGPNITGLLRMVVTSVLKRIVLVTITIFIAGTLETT